MGAHNDTANDYALFQDGTQSPVIPASGGTFNLTGRDRCFFSVGAGTYKLPDGVPEGVSVFIHATGAVTIQTVNSVTVSELTSGQVAICTAISATAWDGALYVADANDIPYDDTSTAATTVGAALAELQSQFTVASAGHVDIPLNCFRETASGDVGDTTANGGVLSSNTTPILEGAGATGAQRINWATGNVDPISASISLPPDFDGTAACSVGLICASAGTTNDFDAVIITNWDGGADVSDTVVDTAATAVHASSATVAAADIPDAPLSVAVTITPPTHATDAFYLYGVRIRYNKALLEA